MNVCKCKCSGVDLETYQCRIMGDVKCLAELDYNFFDEILLCMDEQGFELNHYLSNIQGDTWIFVDYEPVKKLEDKIIKELLKEYD